MLPLGLQFELFVDDVAVSVRFYGATLGLLPPESWSPDGYVPLRAGAVVRRPAPTRSCLLSTTSLACAWPGRAASEWRS